MTETEGFPSGVLIRGVKLTGETSLHLDGPGKLTRQMGITREHNGMDVTMDENIYIRDIGLRPDFETTPRIGISKAKEKLWRFVIQKRWIDSYNNPGSF